ncbi:STE24 endopeptidase [Sulfurivirga caldicuralii]|uniref:STE24 endopeptidase n=1 Tax=Sulfurivirga caldicuralii TaxID=364032 RepID=A0A1N6G6C2_9GAMM|nr:M48 family metallopeptidase [Sulfurivirga caldicuralii]SIO03096.1 STE24 endopeptidase [Sulfurivirga caldicuralii]
MNWISELFIAALTLHVIIELVLNVRQSVKVGLSRKAVPEPFADRITLEDHQKAVDYTRAKLRLARQQLFFDAAILYVMTLGGGFEALYRLWLDSGLAPLWRETGFVLTTLWLLSLLHLPFQLIRTFKIEAEFGFNRTTPRQFVIDLIKGWLLGAALGIPIVAALVWLMQQLLDAQWWLWAWALWMGFNLFILWAWPRWIAPLFNKFTPLEDDTLRQRIENLLARTGFASNGVFVMDGSRRSSHGNAYFAGMGRNKRIVFFDTLLEKLEPEEIEAVLAHELGHFRHGHIKKRLLLSALISLAGFWLLNWLMQQPEFFTGLGVQPPSPGTALVLFVTAVPVFFFWLGPLMALLSRKHEFEADAFAAEQVGSDAMIRALLKLYRDNAAPLVQDEWYSAWHDSHPPAPVRIEHLQRHKEQHHD